MTAEIAILNKLGVALAADSIVTISGGRSEKTYNNSRKLFTLSKFHPVGVLTYGSVEVDTLPVEIIIKEFRERLQDSSRPTLEDYSREFIDFVSTFTPSDDKTDQKNFRGIAEDHADTIGIRFRRECRARNITRSRTDFTSDMDDALSEVLANLEADISDAGPFPALKHVSRADIATRYPNVIPEAVNKEFDDPAPSAPQTDRMSNLIADRILSNKISDTSCGIVVAGYGKGEHYPSVLEHDTEGKIFDILKIVTEDPIKIDDNNQSEIRAYAQRITADLFIRGVDPGYQRFINDGVRELLPGLASEVAAHLSVTDRPQIDAMRQIFEGRAEAFVKSMADRRYDHFVKPLYDAVDMLDIPELAALAEHLVSLAALKQKISLDLETVGGPVDVAVISKHDGFIWIKRKHYFSAELNPSFVLNYLKPRS